MADQEDYVATFVTHAVELDPMVRARVIRLAELALDRAEFLILHGDPNIQSNLVRSFMSIFAKQMQVKKVDDEIVELKEALSILTTAVMGYKPNEQPPVDVNSDAIIDVPPSESST